MSGLAALSLSVVASIARAEGSRAKTEHFDLVWQAPRGCPAADEVAAAVARLLSAGVPGGKRTLLVQGSVTSTSRGAELRLEMREGERPSRRELSAKTCAELSDAAALVIALAINPELASAAQVMTVPPVALECPVQGPPECPAPPVCELPSPSPAPAPSCPVLTTPDVSTGPAEVAASSGFRGAIGVSATLGALPQAWPSPKVSAAYAVPQGRLELSVGMAWATRASSGGATVATFHLLKLTPRGCLAHHLGSVTLDYCAGVETGLLRAQGFGTDTVHTRWSGWVSPLLAVDFALPAALPGLVLDFQVATALVRDRFRLAQTSVFRPSLILPSIGVLGSFGVL